MYSDTSVASRTRSRHKIPKDPNIDSSVTDDDDDDDQKSETKQNDPQSMMILPDIEDVLDYGDDEYMQFLDNFSFKGSLQSESVFQAHYEKRLKMDRKKEYGIIRYEV